MAEITIVNASPRAPKSNSKIYAQIFSDYSDLSTDYFNLSPKNHLEIAQKLDKCNHLLFVFPLYADSIPVGLLNFLKFLEQNPPQKKPVVSVIVNCGFLEYSQNDIAVQQLKLFCSINDYPVGSVLKIGSGEAILDTPFAFLVKRKIKKTAHSISKKRYVNLHTTMPLFKKTFIKASTNFWINKGKSNGITKEQMETMKIEDDKVV